jgi:hypothetical protein
VRFPKNLNLGVDWSSDMSDYYVMRVPSLCNRYWVIIARLDYLYCSMPTRAIKAIFYTRFHHEKGTPPLTHNSTSSCSKSPTDTDRNLREPRASPGPSR